MTSSGAIHFAENRGGTETCPLERRDIKYMTGEVLERVCKVAKEIAFAPCVSGLSLTAQCSKWLMTV
jgi:hypothetical protein